MKEQYFLSLKQLRFKYKSWTNVEEYSYSTLIETDKWLHECFMSESMVLNEKAIEEAFKDDLEKKPFNSIVPRGTISKSKKDFFKSNLGIFVAVCCVGVLAVTVLNKRR